MFNRKIECANASMNACGCERVGGRKTAFQHSFAHVCLCVCVRAQGWELTCQRTHRSTHTAILLAFTGCPSFPIQNITCSLQTNPYNSDSLMSACVRTRAFLIFMRVMTTRLSKICLNSFLDNLSTYSPTQGTTGWSLSRLITRPWRRTQGDYMQSELHAGTGDALDDRTKLHTDAPLSCTHCWMETGHPTVYNHQ